MACETKLKFQMCRNRAGWQEVGRIHAAAMNDLVTTNTAASGSLATQRGSCQSLLRLTVKNSSRGEKEKKSHQSL